MKLKKINLNKIDDCNHPDISTRKKYLVKYEGHFYIGKFKKEWYGLYFDGIYNAGAQLDYGFQGIWEILKLPK